MASGTTHRYWEFTEAAARRAQEVNFYKNVGYHRGLAVLLRERSWRLEFRTAEVY